MKVCLLTPEFLPQWGGIGTYTYQLARGLRDRAEVHVVTSGRSRSGAPTAGLDGVQIHAITPEDARTDGLGLSFQMAVFRRLPALARAHRFDVIHANHAYMSDLLVGRVTSTPLPRSRSTRRWAPRSKAPSVRVKASRAMHERDRSPGGGRCSARSSGATSGGPAR